MDRDELLADVNCLLSACEDLDQEVAALEGEPLVLGTRLSSLGARLVDGALRDSCEVAVLAEKLLPTLEQIEEEAASSAYNQNSPLLSDIDGEMKRSVARLGAASRQLGESLEPLTPAVLSDRLRNSLTTLTTLIQALSRELTALDHLRDEPPGAFVQRGWRDEVLGAKVWLEMLRDGSGCHGADLFALDDQGQVLQGARHPGPWRPGQFIEFQFAGVCSSEVHTIKLQNF